MAKALLYRLFKFGKIPESLKRQLESEGLLLQDEGIPGSVTYLNFRSPTRYSNWRRVWSIASLALTQSRLVALMYSRPAIDVPFTDERFKGLGFSVEKGNTLKIALEASLFHSDWSGELEYRFNTDQAQYFLDEVNARAKG